MAKHHRLFIAFAIEDEWARDHLVGQMKNNRSPFMWTDMSVKQPWATDWRNRCRNRIKTCDGMIAIVTNHTALATGQLFEVRTAKQELVPVIGMYAKRDNRPRSLPGEFAGVDIYDWSWDNILWFLSRI